MSTKRTAERSVGAVVSASLARGAARLDKHSTALVQAYDAEQLHQCRVATRRLRSDLRTLRSLVDRDWADALRTELKWLGDVLGAVRDLDVLKDTLTSEVSALRADDRVDAAPLFVRLGDQQTSARAAVVAAFSATRYGALVGSLRNAAAEPKLTHDPMRSAKPIMPKLVRRGWARLEQAVVDLDEIPTDAELHRVRIKAKRVRYACELAEPEWGKRASRLAASAANVQGVLGELNDAVVGEAWLRAAAHDLPDARVVAGMFVAERRAAAARSRQRFPRVWRDAARPKLRSWLA